MRQHITIEQLNELSDKGKKRLREWSYLKGYYEFKHNPNPDKRKEWIERGLDQEIVEEMSTRFDYVTLLSIGQCIEFLDEQFMEFDIGKSMNPDGWELGINGNFDYENSKLIDALWEACKEVLEKDH